MKNLGYCCINMSLPACKVNRGMTKSTFTKRGTAYCSELIIKNLSDLQTILEWNLLHNIHVYRMSSSMFPWMSSYALESIPNWDLIKEKLSHIGSFIKKNNIRVGFHPDHFNVLGSQNVFVVANTVAELCQHGNIMDYMGLDSSPYYGINIHLNTTQPTKKEAIKRFINNFKLLNESTQRRLTVEIDDKVNSYTAWDLLEVNGYIGCPIVFDNLHFSTNTSNAFDFDTTFKVCAGTWNGFKPLIHWSSSKRIHEDIDARFTAHADYIFDKIPDICNNVDIEIEAKAKDLALLKYRKDFE